MKSFFGNIEKKVNLFIGLSIVAVFLFVLTACEPKDYFHGDPVTITFNGNNHNPSYLCYPTMKGYVQSGYRKDAG